VQSGKYYDVVKGTCFKCIIPKVDWERVKPQVCRPSTLKSSDWSDVFAEAFSSGNNACVLRFTKHVCLTPPSTGALIKAYARCTRENCPMRYAMKVHKSPINDEDCQVFVT